LNVGGSDGVGKVNDNKTKTVKMPLPAFIYYKNKVDEEVEANCKQRGLSASLPLRRSCKIKPKEGDRSDGINNNDTNNNNNNDDDDDDDDDSCCCGGGEGGDGLGKKNGNEEGSEKEERKEICSKSDNGKKREKDNNCSEENDVEKEVVNESPLINTTPNSALLSRVTTCQENESLLSSVGVRSSDRNCSFSSSLTKFRITPCSLNSDGGGGGGNNNNKVVSDSLTSLSTSKGNYMSPTHHFCSNDCSSRSLPPTSYSPSAPSVFLRSTPPSYHNDDI
jgi:hypothetical protein